MNITAQSKLLEETEKGSVIFKLQFQLNVIPNEQWKNAFVAEYSATCLPSTLVENPILETQNGVAFIIIILKEPHHANAFKRMHGITHRAIEKANEKNT